MVKYIARTNINHKDVKCNKNDELPQSVWNKGEWEVVAKIEKKCDNYWKIPSIGDGSSDKPYEPKFRPTEYSESKFIDGYFYYNCDDDFKDNKECTKLTKKQFEDAKELKQKKV